jgi:VanZ family protein
LRPSSFNIAWFWRLAFLLWCLLVIWLSLTPAPPRFRFPLLGWDKLQHFAAYTLLTILAANSFRYLRPLTRRSWCWAAGFALLFGIGMECLQYLLHRGRLADLKDVTANGAGILAACLLGWIWRRTWGRRRLK